ncbi:Inhibitor of vertebrate lysozyme [Burkholderia arboris]|uniref:Inhibitor of vertebrate lysozyme n=1 Tax=Burkholderia arboris TaxID=488730 RepID=A0A9Q9SNJ6_9BURK|nr:Ivy family C-type lysozyme inhibitor [Burkholderia arboris]VWC19104.1 Inhibitor of vertebrate lysozyme [Burkholderia arboris]
MYIRMPFAAAALFVAQAVWAGSPATTETWTMSAIAGNRAASAAFDAMKKGHQLPAWVVRGGTESPSITVSFGGHDVYVMTACKPHDCSSESIAVLYDPQKNEMYGVLSTVSPKKGTERLTWLNIGGGDESIDGRTILYAALTGSLANHPGAFNYK